MFIKLNFTTAQPPSIWFDSVYWIMANKSIWYTSAGQGALNASLFKDSVNASIITYNPGSGNVSIYGSTPTVVNAGSFVTGVSYTIKDTGTTTTWSGVGAVATTTGTPFVATGAGSGNGTAYLSNTVVAATALVIGSRYTIGYMGTTTSANWNTAAGTSGVTYAVGSSFTATATTSGTGLAYLTSSIALSTVIQTSIYDSTNSEIINTTIAGTMPVVNYYQGNTTQLTTGTTGATYRISTLGTVTSGTWPVTGAWAGVVGSSFTYNGQTLTGTGSNFDTPPMLTFKSVINDAPSSSSWLQISTTTFKNSGNTTGATLTSNSTTPTATSTPVYLSGTPIVLGTSSNLQQSSDQAWNDPLDINSYCYWIYISPTCIAWAAAKPPAQTKVGWYTSYSSVDWPAGSSANTKQVGPFMVSQYTRLDVWNTDANSIIPVCWINGRDLAWNYRNYYGLSYTHDIGWGNLNNLNLYNPRLNNSNGNAIPEVSNTAFSVQSMLDGTPNSTNLYFLPIAGVKVNFGTNIRSHSDIASLANSTYLSGGSAYPSIQSFQSSSTLPYASSPTATTTTSVAVTNSSTITVASGTGIAIGQIVTGPGINPDSSVGSKYGNTTTVYVAPSYVAASTTVPLTSPITAVAGTYNFYNTTTYTNPSGGKTQISDNSVARSPFSGIQGASVWDNTVQSGAHTRWPTATTSPTGAFSLQPLVWSRADYNAIGGLISDKSSIYLFNGDYLAGDEFSSGGQAYSIWPLADGFSQRVGLAVPKK
jgi:hypothetical protein